MASRLVERFSDDGRALDMAAKLHNRLGDTPHAVSIWEQCLTLAPNHVEARVSLGKVRFEAGDFTQAEAALRPVAAQVPADAEAAFLLGSALFHQGKFSETVQVLENCRAASVPNLASEVLLGQAFLALRRHERAKACFLAAIELAPEYPNAYFGLASACDALGEADEAARHRRKFRELQADQLRQAIDQTGRYDDERTTRQDLAEFYVAAGRLYLERGDEAAAQQHWRQALELDSQNERGRAELAQLYAGTGRLREAVEVLRPLRETRAADASFWQRLAQLYAQLQAFDDAEEALCRIVELAPQQAFGYAARAQLRLEMNRDPAEAAELARQAVERTPSAANYFLWSVASERSGDGPQAKAAIVKALERDPGNAQYQQRYLTLEAGR
jgi:tetratricopeptide (TPR) repeat protein